LRFITGAVVVFVHAVEKEMIGNAFARVVVMVAAEKEPIRISRIIVLGVVSQIQKMIC
jgi:hypothetical protein